MITNDRLQAQLAQCLEGTHFTELGVPYFGKVRDNYTQDDRRTIIVTDRISAFDRVLGTLPFKGQVLNQLSSHWFGITRDLCPNHLVSVPDPTVTVARECTPVPVEIVVRAYLTGVTSTSIWVAYERGDRVFCGHSLPTGMKKNEKLPKPIVTPSTKAEKGAHDRSASREEILAMGQVSAAVFDEMNRLALTLFAFGSAHLASRGLILVDTKYEFGTTSRGDVVLIDEIHTPDSSRFWYRDSYEARLAEGKDPEGLDKEYVRRWLVSQGYSGDGPSPRLPDEVRVEAARRYIEAYEKIVGRPFEPNAEEPMARIRKNLRIPVAS